MNSKQGENDRFYFPTSGVLTPSDKAGQALLAYGGLPIAPDPRHRIDWKALSWTTMSLP